MQIIDSKTELTLFWKILEDKLIENGKPFSILYEKGGKIINWAVINKKRSFVDNALSIDFLGRDKKVRVNIYVRNDLELFSIFERNKEDIESTIGVPLKWVEGMRNGNTRRIAYEIPIVIGYYSNYDRVVDEILPVAFKMKKVCEKYAKNSFFDF